MSRQGNKIKVAAVVFTLVLFGGFASALDVSIDSTNSPVTEGDSLNVEVTADNNEGSYESEDIRLKIGDKVEDTSYNVGVFGGDSASFNLKWNTDVGDAGHYTVKVVGDTDSDTEEVAVQPTDSESNEEEEDESNSAEDNLRLNIIGTSSPVGKGNNLVVDYKVRNTGESFESQDIDFFIDGSRKDTNYNVGILSGETVRDKFEYSTAGLGQGTYTAKIENQGDQETAIFTVETNEEGNEEPAFFDVSIDDTNSPVHVGENIRVEATIENTGEEFESQDIEMFVNGDRVDTEYNVGVFGEDKVNLEFEWETSSEDEGSHNVKISSEDDSETRSVSVEGEQNDKPSINLRAPTGSNVDTSPDYTWKISDDEDWMEYVKLIIDDDSDPFSNPERSYDSRDEATMPNRANSVRDYSSIYHTLDEDTRYWWGIKASDGEYTVRKKASFVTEGDRDYVNEEPRADLDVSTVSSSGSYERLKFDARDSSDPDGSINRYEFDFDGDGIYERDRRYDGVEYKSYYSDFSGYARVRVYDNDGDSDVAREYIDVDVGGDDEDDSDDEYNERPEAEFDYSPSSPRVGQQVTFDASSSSDDEGIVDYSWSFGDDGSSAGRTVTHTFDEASTYPVSLTVEDDEGKEDTWIRYVSVGLERGACGVSQDSFRFSLDEYVIDEGESTEAELQVYNSGTRDQDVEVVFKVDSDTVEERTVEVEAGGSEKVTEEVSPERDSLITAEVATTGSPCGYEQFSDLRKELIVLSGGDEEASLDVNVDSDEGYVRNARVEVDGPEDRVRYTDIYGSQSFRLEPGDYDVEVSHPDYEGEEDDVELDAGESEDLDFYLDRDDDGEGSLEINVVDEHGDDVDDARVEVENGDREVERTNYRGFASFDLHPDDYDVTVTHPDYDDTARTSVNIDAGEVKSRTLTLFDDETDGIEIVDVDFPSSVCRGDTLAVDYTVRNNEGYDRSAQTTATGFDSSIVTNTYVIDSGDSVSGTLRFTNVQGSGKETFDIRVENGATAEVSRTVTVEDCTTQDPVDQDSSGVSMKLSYPISPNKALVGDTVKVSGFVDGVTSRTEVEVDVNGDRKARVSTQPDGYYQTYIRMDSTGMKTVRARAGGNSASREIQVLPTASVGMVDAPRKVFQGEAFEVCSEVTSQVKAKVLLLEDGRMLDSTNANGEVCFDVDASDVGRHTYEVRALTSGEGSSSTASVEVLETDVEAESFPGQIASVESGSGMIKVELYNTHQSTKRYDVDLEGLPSTWTSQTEKQVVLSSGERRTVYFYLTPREEGNYDPEVIVNADNQEVYRQKVDLYTGGQTEPRNQGFLNQLRGLFSL